MSVTRREKTLLWKLLEFDIYRYLMANSCHRLDGNEKAQRHINISKTIVGYITGDVENEDNEDFWLPIHDYLADILTNKMDVVIGFPINKPIYGNEYDEYAEKFFDVIIENMDDIANVIDQHLHDEEPIDVSWMWHCTNNEHTEKNLMNYKVFIYGHKDEKLAEAMNSAVAVGFRSALRKLEDLNIISMRDIDRPALASDQETWDKNILI